MELMLGYKQTEAGVIPEEWTAETLGSYVKIKSGESPSLFHFGNDGVPYFKVEQLNNNSKYLHDTPYFFREGKKVPRGSLIFPKKLFEKLTVRQVARVSFGYDEPNLPVRPV